MTEVIGSELGDKESMRMRDIMSWRKIMTEIIANYDSQFQV